MKVLFLGEIVGRCGIGVIKNELKKFRKANGVDLVIANGEGGTSGFGLGFTNAQSLRHMGIDIITMGEKAFYKLDMMQSIDKCDKLMRPANYPDTAPGKGMKYFNFPFGKICVINMLGMLGFQNPHLNNPFLISKALVEKAKAETPYVFYIFHSQATAEKLAMGYLLDGFASAVIGTHTKVLTADACIMPKGTAYITDTGRCGSACSVGGFTPDNEIAKFRNHISVRSSESWEDPQLQGILVEFSENGQAVNVTTVQKKVEVECIQKSE